MDFCPEILDVFEQFPAKKPEWNGAHRTRSGILYNAVKPAAGPERDWRRAQARFTDQEVSADQLRSAAWQIFFCGN